MPSLKQKSDLLNARKEIIFKNVYEAHAKNSKFNN